MSELLRSGERPAAQCGAGGPHRVMVLKHWWGDPHGVTVGTRDTPGICPTSTGRNMEKQLPGARVGRAAGRKCCRPSSVGGWPRWGEQAHLYGRGQGWGPTAPKAGTAPGKLEAGSPLQQGLPRLTLALKQRQASWLWAGKGGPAAGAAVGTGEEWAGEGGVPCLPAGG